MPMQGYWRSLIGRGLLLAATVAVSAVNGLTFSPIFDSMGYALYLFTRGSPLVTPDLIFYLTPLCIAAMTLLIAGIPAAVYERIRGLEESTAVSLGIWLVTAAILTLPTLMQMIGEDWQQ